MSVLSDINYTRAYPLANRTGTGFSGGELNYNFIVPNDKILVLKESELVIQLDVAQYNNAGTPALIPLEFGFSNSPVSCFFTRCEIHVGNKKIWEMTEYAQMSTLHTILTSSPTELDSSIGGNPIALSNVALSATQAASATLALNADKIEVATRNLLDIGVIKATAGKKHLTFSAKLPCDIETITGNSEVSIKFIIDRKFPNNLLMLGSTDNATNGLSIVDGTSAVTATSIANVSNVGAPVAALQIQMSVTDTFMNLKMYKTDTVMINKPYQFSFGNYTADTKSVVSRNENLIFTSARNPSHIGFFFVDSRDTTLLANTHISPTYFNTLSTSVLDEYQLEYSGNYYPSNTTYVNFDTSSQDQKETVKSYKEFVNSLEGLTNIPALSYRQWRKHPIILYRVAKPIGDLNTTVRLRLKFSADPANMTVVFFSYYQSDASINYDSNGNVSNVTVEEIV